MERRIFKCLLYFLVILTGNVVINALFKEDLNLLTAFSIALGVSVGIVYFGPYMYKKFSKG